MRKQGTVIHWDAERGFGFIAGAKAGADILFKTRDYRGGPVPKPGQTVTFRQVVGSDGNPRAVSVMPATDLRDSDPTRGMELEPLDRESEWAMSVTSELNQRPRQRQAPARASDPAWPLYIALLVLWLGLLGWGYQTARLPLGVLLLAALVNVVTFLLYWSDKAAAHGGRWRTAERKLHLMDVLGGWPLAWIAQRLLRHKSRKSSFRVMFWITAVIHCVALAVWVFWPATGAPGSV